LSARQLKGTVQCCYEGRDTKAIMLSFIHLYHSKSGTVMVDSRRWLVLCAIAEQKLQPSINRRRPQVGVIAHLQHCNPRLVLLVDMGLQYRSQLELSVRHHRSGCTCLHTKSHNVSLWLLSGHSMAGDRCMSSLADTGRQQRHISLHTHTDRMSHNDVIKVSAHWHEKWCQQGLKEPVISLPGPTVHAAPAAFGVTQTPVKIEYPAAAAASLFCALHSCPTGHSPAAIHADQSIQNKQKEKEIKR